jgi:hypothetical protein
MPEKPIDAKYLAGLKYRTSKPGEVGGKPVPVERDLTPKDVIGWSGTETTITIVTADGQKHLVGKERKTAPTAGDDKKA